MDMATRNEDAAARDLQQCHEQLAAEKQRILEIEGYYTDYEKLFQQQNRHINAETLSYNRKFLQKLSDTRRAQMEQLKVTEVRLEKSKQAWRICHLKCDNLKSLVNDVRQQEIKVMENNEQKVIDEWSTQFHSRRDDC